MNKKILILAISVMVGLAVAHINSQENSSAALEEIQELQQTIAEKILRFHVIANSNSTEDQDLKLKVKEHIAIYIESLLEDSDSLEASIDTIKSHNEDILAKAEAFIKACGYDYDVQGLITTTYFPIKTYGDITLPAGQYLAYELIIGEGSGANWWCILYPPLCFVDLTTGVVPDESKEALMDILDKSEYTLITTGKPEINEIRFKYLTFLNDILGLNQ